MRNFGKAILLSLIVSVLYLNYGLYYTPKSFTYGPYCVNEEVCMQLRFLAKALREDHAAEEMQGLYPEGFVFLNALYGLAWCDVAETFEPESTSQQEALREIGFALNEIDSEQGRRIFNPYLPLSYGAFYQGWSAYLRGRSLQLQAPELRDSVSVRQFGQQCDKIALALQQTDAPYLETYNGLAWPADNILCLAALALHDRVFEPRFEGVRSTWLNRIKDHLVPDYQLIPHGFDLKNNQPLEGVRGSSQTLMLRFLIDIDPDFAQTQYRQYRKYFLAYRFGLPGIREYPNDYSSPGDVDSGPVVMGIGGVSSIVGIGTAARFGDCAVYAGLRNSVEALLLPWHSGEKKQYLFGQLPMVDAFMAWSNPGICRGDCVTGENWRWKFQAISAILIFLSALMIWKLNIKTNAKS